MSTERLALDAASVRISAQPHPFRAARVDLVVPAGLTIAEMIARAQPDPLLRAHAHAFIDDHYVPRVHWGRVRPKPGAFVTIRVVPGLGGGSKGKNPLRTVLTIAVAVAALTLGGPLGGVLLDGAASTTFLGATISASALGGALIGIAGSLLISAVAPPPRPRLRALSGPESAGRDSPTLFLTGSRNRANPFGVVPRPLGRNRMTPPYGARPFTEIIGDDQYLRLLFVWGYGPLDLSDLRIGETPITSFDAVEIETRKGFPNDPPLTLYTRDVFEDSLQIVLKQAEGWSQRTSQPDADELSVDITFPQGLVAFTTLDAQGNPGPTRKVDQTVEVEVQSSPVGQGTWTPRGTLSVTARQTSAVRRGLRFTLPRGQYDVRLRRITPDTSANNVFDSVLWTALRSITAEDPIGMTGIAKTAVRIKASEELNGVVDTLNGVVHSILPDWDTASQSWIERPTSNPAALYRAVLQGPGNARPLPDSRVDLAGLQAWHEANTAAGRSFNMVIDFASSVRAVLADIAATGRAAPAIHDANWGVVIDAPQSVPVQHFTPRNSWGFQGAKAFPDLPHGWRVRFVNAEKDWHQDERIVYDDGFDASNATRFEGLELPGITDPAQIWKDGRYHIATARLRPETTSFFADIEHIVAERGDLIRMTHDVPLWGLASGRVKAVIDDGTNATGVILDERVAMAVGRSYTLRFRKADGSSLLQAVSTAPGETATLSFAAPIPLAYAPAPDDLAMFGETGTESVALIVKSIEPGQDLTARITCVDAAPAVHQADQGPIPPFQSRITLPPGLEAPAVMDLRSDERVLLALPDGSFAPRVLITLGLQGARRGNATAIEARYRPAGSDGPWTSVLAPPAATEVALTAVEMGERYEITLRFLADSGPGPWSALLTHTVIGTDTLPPDVPALFREGDTLRWDYPDPPRDFAGFKLASQAGLNRSWATAVPAHDGLLSIGAFDLSGIPRGLRTVLVAAFDVAGNRSAGVASLVVDLGDQFVDNIILSDDLAAEGFPGTITGGSVVAGALTATSLGQAFWSGDGEPLWTGMAQPFWTETFEAMVYTAALTPGQDLLDATLTVDLAVVASSWSLAYRPDSQAPLWEADTEPFWSGDTAQMWAPRSAFKAWPGALTGLRHKQYELRLTTAAGPTRGTVSAFTARFDVPDAREQIEDFLLPAAGARLPLTKRYRRIVNVNLTLQDDGGNAVTVKALDKDARLGPRIRAFDAALMGASATIDATIQGIQAP